MLILLTAIVVIILILVKISRCNFSLTLLNDLHHVVLELLIIDIATTLAPFHVSDQLCPLFIANVDFSARPKGLLELPGADTA